jgi:signal transduction histidine kinase
MKLLSILIADDYALVRRGMRTLLESQPNWQVCGEAQNGREALEEARRLKPDLAVLDIAMPELNGLEAIARIRKEVPQTLCLFRVLQEALHNAAKHSRARSFEVQLWGTSGEVQLTVRDFGVGFDPEVARQGRGLGLISMQERLNLVSGRISIQSEPQAGTVVNVRVPASAPPQFRP